MLIDQRKWYWRHRPRNQAITALAEAFERPDASIAILVENSEHSRELSRYLPSWLVVRKGTAPKDLPPRLIITLTAAESISQFQPDTLVIGLGGRPSTWLIDLVAKLNRAGKAIRIIDLTDGFDDSAGRLAAARARAYRDSGWHWCPLDRSVVRCVGRAIRGLKAKEPIQSERS
jgi:hypothetical protein